MMNYANNCPAVPQAFDPGRPVSHTRPVSHVGMPLQDWHPHCLWDQLQWERERGGGGAAYLENLEAEWAKRNLCSHCLREEDHPYMLEVDDLRHQLARAESKLTAISETARLLPDGGFKMAAIEILDREKEPWEPGAEDGD